MAIGFTSFQVEQEIPACFISFQGNAALSAAPADRLAEGRGDRMNIKTENGEVSISRLDGYRILYKNENGAAFVKLKG
jgi:hypothetical protein